MRKRTKRWKGNFAILVDKDDDNHWFLLLDYPKHHCLLVYSLLHVSDIIGIHIYWYFLPLFCFRWCRLACRCDWSDHNAWWQMRRLNYSLIHTGMYSGTYIFVCVRSHKRNLIHMQEIYIEIYSIMKSNRKMFVACIIVNPYLCRHTK